MSTYARQATEKLAAVLGLGGADVPQATQIEAAIDQAMAAQRERCLAAVRGERLTERLKNYEDEAYQQALDDAERAIRSLGPAPSETPPAPAEPRQLCCGERRLGALDGKPYCDSCGRDWPLGETPPGGET